MKGSSECVSKNRVKVKKMKDETFPEGVERAPTLA